MPNSIMAAAARQRLADAPDVLTVRDVMRILGIGPDNAYMAVRSGQIPSVRIGRRYLIPKVAFERWLRNAGGVSS